MVTLDADAGRSLLEREEAALARKRAAIKSASTSLEALRRSSTEAREALQSLRELGFAQREITESFGLSRDETLQLFPRRPRGAGAAEEGVSQQEEPLAAIASDAPGPHARETLSRTLDDQAQQPGHQPQAQ